MRKKRNYSTHRINVTDIVEGYFELHEYDRDKITDDFIMEFVHFLLDETGTENFVYMIDAVIEDYFTKEEVEDLKLNKNKLTEL